MANEETDETTEEASPPSKAPASKALEKKQKIKKKQSAAEVQKELREIGKSQEPDRPPVDLKKIYLRVAGVAVVVWIIALGSSSMISSSSKWIPVGVAGAASIVAIGVCIWLDRWVKKTMALQGILKGADTDEGRKKALEQLETNFKKGDTQATIAKAQLQMQEDPRAALATLEGINCEKELAPIAGQVRSLRAMLHLSFGETSEARQLADLLELGKQQEPKTRVMFATVAAEAWARTGEQKKALDTLELFNPEAPENAEMRMQLWRARAFAYAALGDTKGVARAVKKLGEINPHILGMFMPPQKKIHPLLEREAKQQVQRMGIVPRKMVRQKM